MEAIIAGILSGVISPLILSWLQQRVIWKNQKRLEIKFTIFQDAVRALSLWATDALDPKLQSEKVAYMGITRVTDARLETWELIEKSRGLVRAFFLQKPFLPSTKCLERIFHFKQFQTKNLKENARKPYF